MNPRVLIEVVSTFEVDSERLSFLDAQRRMPTHSVTCEGEDIGSFEFSSPTEFAGTGVFANMKGIVGSISEGRTGYWYLEIFEDEVLKVNAVGSGRPILAIADCNEIFRWGGSPARGLEIKRSDGEVLARSQLKGESKDLTRVIEIWNVLDEPVRTRLLAFLVLLSVRLPWYTLRTQAIPWSQL